MRWDARQVGQRPHELERLFNKLQGVSVYISHGRGSDQIDGSDLGTIMAQQ